MFEASKQMMKEKSPFLSFFTNIMLDAQIQARLRDVQECYELYNTAKSYLDNPISWIKIISYDKLDYTCPIAFQGMVALITGINGELINDNFNHKNNYKMEYLHVAVFPLKKSTAIITFMASNNSRYVKFEESISKLTQSQRLEVINRIIFLYAEDYYLSKELDDEIIHSLQEPASLLQDLVTTTPKRSIKNAVKDYDLRRDICIPNLFLEEYSIRTKETD